jgi:hypothetical protein
MLETLLLVAVDVFGKGMITSHQALLLLAVFIVIGARRPVPRRRPAAAAQTSRAPASAATLRRADRMLFPLCQAS